MIVLDTNVISELVRRTPNSAVFDYVNRLPIETFFTAAFCQAELRYGLALLPNGQRRTALVTGLEAFFEAGLKHRVLPFDRLCAAVFADIRQARRADGRPISVEDAIIAATARAHGAQVIATRNVADFVGCGVAVVDPWQI